MRFAILNDYLGIGSDLIEIERIRAAHKKHGASFLDRLFSKREQAYCEKYQDPIPRYAGRFAAKEAVVKALGIGVNKWCEIEVINNEHGKPEVFLSADLKKQFPKKHLLVTISHCQSYATATALVIGEYTPLS